MDARCNYIIGFDICDNDILRKTFIEKLQNELKAERVNQSCYKIITSEDIRKMQDYLSAICKTCAEDCGAFQENDFVKLYCSAYLADNNTIYKYDIYEYNINLKK